MCFVYLWGIEALRGRVCVGLRVGGACVRVRARLVYIWEQGLDE